MRILLAIELGGHPFWQRYKYEFMMLDTDSDVGQILNFSDVFFEKDKSYFVSGEQEYYIRPDGLFARLFHCSSGAGKLPRTPEFKLIDKAEYDKVIIIPNSEKRKAEREYHGSWRDNIDFDGK